MGTATNETKNTIVDLKEYFHTDKRPVSMAEFREFWESCTEAEKEEFRNADLP